jgi:pyridoxamine 5'-phosphate oxidase family protein
MNVFTEAESRYLAEQRLGRLATVGRDGAPHVVPVGFRYNTALETIDISGMNMSSSKKFRDVRRDGRVSFVVDDVLPPWRPRGIEIRGLAEAIEAAATDGSERPAAIIRIHPGRIIAWGIDSDPFTKPNARDVGPAHRP